MSDEPPGFCWISANSTVNNSGLTVQFTIFWTQVQPHCLRQSTKDKMLKSMWFFTLCGLSRPAISPNNCKDIKVSMWFAHSWFRCSYRLFFQNLWWMHSYAKFGKRKKFKKVLEKREFLLYNCGNVHGNVHGNGSGSVTVDGNNVLSNRYGL